MSHELETVNGEATIAYRLKTPWHGLGQKLEMGATSKEMMEAAHLDWTVEKRPMFYHLNDGDSVKSNRSALIRSSDQKMLDVVSDDWNPVQNQEAFDFFNEFVADNSMYIETAGSLKGGQYVWAMAKINESFELFNGKDRVEGNLLFTNPHKYGSSIDIRFTAVRVCCQNTLTMALNGNSSNVFKKSHRREFDAEKAKELLGLSHRKLDAYKEKAEFLASKTASKEDVIEYFKRLYPSLSKDNEKEMSRSANRLMEVLDTQPGAEFGEGSWWAAHNAVTYFNDWLAGRSQDNRVFSSWLGSGSDKKQESLTLALEMAS